MVLKPGIIILPSALTLANLFFGIWAIVSASRGEFTTAAWLIVWAALFDTLDGRVARYTQTGSRFGEEMDSLVDGISFGVAPALIIYHLFLVEGTWSWAVVWLYISAAVIRLARFNVEQAGHAKVVFHGLPSPAAGMTLATFYPFTHTQVYQTYFADWPWASIMATMPIVLGFLMMSHIPYPVVPKFGFRTRQGWFNFLFLASLATMAIFIPAIYFFPASIIYVLWGVLKALLLGFFERLPERDPLLDEEGDEAGAELRDIDYGEMSPQRRLKLPRVRRRKRRGRGDNPYGDRQ